jgi:hypothetical protein
VQAPPYREAPAYRAVKHLSQAIPATNDAQQVHSHQQNPFQHSYALQLRRHRLQLLYTRRIVKPAAVIDIGLLAADTHSFTKPCKRRLLAALVFALSQS